MHPDDMPPRHPDDLPIDLGKMMDHKVSTSEKLSRFSRVTFLAMSALGAMMFALRREVIDLELAMLWGLLFISQVAIDRWRQAAEAWRGACDSWRESSDHWRRIALGEQLP
jgi:hypothetical protein